MKTDTGKTVEVFPEHNKVNVKIQLQGYHFATQYEFTPKEALELAHLLIKAAESQEGE